MKQIKWQSTHKQLIQLIHYNLNGKEELQLKQCQNIPIWGCCSMRWTSECVPKHCFKYILANCPDRKILMFKRSMKQKSDLRRSPNSAFHGHSLVHFPNS